VTGVLEKVHHLRTAGSHHMRSSEPPPTRLHRHRGMRPHTHPVKGCRQFMRDGEAAGICAVLHSQQAGHLCVQGRYRGRRTTLAGERQHSGLSCAHMHTRLHANTRTCPP
jgi:hypothetical protein